MRSLISRYPDFLAGSAEFRDIQEATGRFADVLRKTNHTVLGYKGGMLYGVYCRSMTAQQVNAFCRDKLKLEYAVMLDGGHVAAINGACNKINTNQRQYYAVRFL